MISIDVGNWESNDRWTFLLIIMWFHSMFEIQIGSTRWSHQALKASTLFLVLVRVQHPFAHTHSHTHTFEVYLFLVYNLATIDILSYIWHLLFDKHNHLVALLYVYTFSVEVTVIYFIVIHNHMLAMSIVWENRHYLTGKGILWNGLANGQNERQW